MQKTLSNILEFTTARLVVDRGAGKCSIGTAFFVQIPSETEGQVYPLLVTNRHVVEGGKSAVFKMTCKDADGNPDITKHVEITISDISAEAFFHPDPTIDLCLFAIGQYINDQKAKGVGLFYVPIDRELILKPEDEESVEALADILMIGYPIGLWDKVNNMPITRKGILATPIYLDYEGTPHFLMDIPVIQGSSGSPIFLYEDNVYFRDNQTYIRKDRVKLCGINKAVYNFNVLGEEKTAFDIQDTKLMVETKVPANIGIAIKSSQLLSLIDHILSNKLLL